MVVRLVRNHSHWGAFLAEVEDGRLVGVRPFELDPDPSPLIAAIPEAVQSPMRIKYPMVREGWLKNGPGNGEGRGRERFVRVSWEKALDLAAGELARVKRDFGNAAIMGGSQGWGSAGILHDARTQLRRFLSSFGGFVDQATNYSFGAALAFLPHVLGTAQAVNGPLTSWSSIARNARLMVLFGGANSKNTQVIKGGCASHPVGGWIEAMAKAGVRVVNVSPLKDDGPVGSHAEWIPIRPNTDTALMLALAHTLLAENLQDKAFLASHCAGFERVRPYLAGESDGTPKTPEWAEGITGVPAETTRALARAMAADRTMLTASWSLQRADHGEQPYWALVLLAAMLGQVGLPGGGFGFGYGSSAGIGEPPLAFKGPAMEALANPLKLAIPAARIAECLANPGAPYDFNGRRANYPDIRLVYWAGGNPFHHHQDLNNLRRAWARPETVVVHEPWWTATARHADIVLPATTTLERTDIGCGPRDRFIIAMDAAIAPVGESRDDFEVFRALARRVGCEEAYTEGRDQDAWLRHLYEKARAASGPLANTIPDYDGFRTTGWFEIPKRADAYEFLAEFRSDPERNKLTTPSGKIELYSERIAAFGYDDCPPHPTWIAPAEWLGAPLAAEYPLHLISSQPRTRLHSQMDCGPVSGAGKIAGREAIAINRADAKLRGIAPGDVVRVFNDRGECLAGAEVTDDVRRGVVRLSCGAWYDPVDPSGESLCAHGNANVLTRDRGTSKLAQGPTSATTLVEVARWQGEAPPVRAFTPPEVVEA